MTETVPIGAKEFQDFEKRLLEEQEKIWNKYMELNDLAQRQEKTRAQVETSLNEKLAALDKRMDKLDAMLQQPIITTAKESSPAHAEFSEYLRKGVVGPNMTKALLENTNTLGGYLAPPEYVREIIKGLVEYSPIREYARVSTITGSVAQIPRKTGSGAASWLSTENTAISETTGLAYGLEEIPLTYMTAKFALSMKLANDAAFDIDAEIRDEVTMQWAVAEGNAFINGTGRGQPEGLLTRSGVAYVASGSATDIKADGIIDTCYTLKDGYARNAVWLMRRSTIGAVRKLKDPTSGLYLWQPTLGAGEPPTLMGYPVVNCPDMPAVAGNAYPIIFADLFNAYRIVDNAQTMFIRDTLSLADQMMIKYVAFRAVGGQVVNPDAVVKLKIATS